MATPRRSITGCSFSLKRTRDGDDAAHPPKHGQNLCRKVRRERSHLLLHFAVLETTAALWGNKTPGNKDKRLGRAGILHHSNSTQEAEKWW